MKIVFLDAATVKAELAKLSFAHEFVVYDSTRPEQVVERLAGANIVITNKVKLGEAEFACLPDLKYICVAATGYNIVDTQAARLHNIAVSNVPAYSNESLPEHILMLVLALKRNLLRYREDVERGKWQASSIFCLIDYEIADVRASNFGIIGYGALGKATARLAECFGARILIAERKGASAVRAGRVGFEEALRESDVLSLHCPLNDETRGLIGERELNQMKRSAILINCARGGIVDEAALVIALKTGVISGAGVDVLTKEPPIHNNILLSETLPNLIVTPHHAWASRLAQRKLAETIINNIEAFIKGEPQNVVNESINPNNMD